MGEQRQSQGREDNAATPVENWEASGILDSKQKDDAESTGRTGQAAGEERTFRDVGGGQHMVADEQKMMQEGEHPEPIPGPHDLQGPAGDPVEGKESGRGSSWPS